MDSKNAARLAFGNPGFLDFLTHPIVSAITGQPQSTIAAISKATQGLTPSLGISTLVEPLVRTAARFIPEAQTFVDIADAYDPFSNEDEAEDDPLGEDGDV